MSLILDALKRAERERKLEKAPDLSAIYQEGRPNRRKYDPRFWVGVASLAAFGVLAFLFWPKEPSRGNVKDKAPKTALTASTPARQRPSKGVSPPVTTPEKSVKKAVVPPPVSERENKRPKIETKRERAVSDCRKLHPMGLSLITVKGKRHLGSSTSRNKACLVSTTPGRNG
ncbi:MAG: hypothetical protein B6240_01970 [Desulfobacteraceae bacterium 4572_87]|nr:MAG: hypothetical protein B6240_01970 [Desulfobacteraceae bacterium 4572_87]